MSNDVEENCIHIRGAGGLDNGNRSYRGAMFVIGVVARPEHDISDLFLQRNTIQHFRQA